MTSHHSPQVMGQPADWLSTKDPVDRYKHPLGPRCTWTCPWVFFSGGSEDYYSSSSHWIHGTIVYPTYMSHKNQPNVGEYILYMDPMGL